MEDSSSNFRGELFRGNQSLGDVKHDEQRPDDTGNDEDDIRDGGRQMPGGGGRTPGISETREAQHHAEIARRHIARNRCEAAG